MRRKVGIAVIAVGTLLLVLAPLLRWYVYPQLAVVAHDTEATTVSTGQDVTIFDISALLAGGDPQRVTDITSTRGTVAIVGDVPGGASDDDVAVWETLVNTTDDTGTLISASSAIVAFDRHTGAGVPGYDQSMDGEPIEHVGQVFKFPFDTQQRDYEFWDGSLREARPAVYAGEESLDGLTVYKFVQTIEPTVVTQIEVPGALAGSEQPSIEADRVYANVRTMWVEPQTGVIIKGQEEQDSVLAFGGQEIAKITSGTIGNSDEQVAANVEEYGGTASLLNLVRNVLPVVLGIVGLLGVVAGVVLLATPRTRRRGRGRFEETDRDEVEREETSLLDFGSSENTR